MFLFKKVSILAASVAILVFTGWGIWQSAAKQVTTSSTLDSAEALSVRSSDGRHIFERAFDEDKTIYKFIGSKTGGTFGIIDFSSLYVDCINFNEELGLLSVDKSALPVGTYNFKITYQLEQHLPAVEPYTLIVKSGTSKTIYPFAQHLNDFVFNDTNQSTFDFYINDDVDSSLINWSISEPSTGLNGKYTYTTNNGRLSVDFDETQIVVGDYFFTVNFNLPNHYATSKQYNFSVTPATLDVSTDFDGTINFGEAKTIQFTTNQSGGTWSNVNNFGSYVINEDVNDNHSIYSIDISNQIPPAGTESYKILVRYEKANYHLYSNTYTLNVVRKTATISVSEDSGASSGEYNHAATRKFVAKDITGRILENGSWTISPASITNQYGITIDGFGLVSIPAGLSVGTYNYAVQFNKTGYQLTQTSGYADSFTVTPAAISLSTNDAIDGGFTKEYDKAATAQIIPSIPGGQFTISSSTANGISFQTPTNGIIAFEPSIPYGTNTFDVTYNMNDINYTPVTKTFSINVTNNTTAAIILPSGSISDNPNTPVYQFTYGSVTDLQFTSSISPAGNWRIVSPNIPNVSSYLTSDGLLKLPTKLAAGNYNFNIWYEKAHYDNIVKSVALNVLPSGVPSGVQINASATDLTKMHNEQLFQQLSLTQSPDFQPANGRWTIDSVTNAGDPLQSLDAFSLAQNGGLTILAGELPIGSYVIMINYQSDNYVPLTLTLTLAVTPSIINEIKSNLGSTIYSLDPTPITHRAYDLFGEEIAADAFTYELVSTTIPETNYVFNNQTGVLTYTHCSIAIINTFVYTLKLSNANYITKTVDLSINVNITPEAITGVAITPHLADNVDAVLNFHTEDTYTTNSYTNNSMEDGTWKILVDATLEPYIQLELTGSDRYVNVKIARDIPVDQFSYILVFTFATNINRVTYSPTIHMDVLDINDVERDDPNIHVKGAENANLETAEYKLLPHIGTKQITAKLFGATNASWFINSDTSWFFGYLYSYNSPSGTAIFNFAKMRTNKIVGFNFSSGIAVDPLKITLSEAVLEKISTSYTLIYDYGYVPIHITESTTGSYTLDDAGNITLKKNAFDGVSGSLLTDHPNNPSYYQNSYYKLNYAYDDAYTMSLLDLSKTKIAVQLGGSAEDVNFAISNFNKTAISGTMQFTLQLHTQYGFMAYNMNGRWVTTPYGNRGDYNANWKTIYEGYITTMNFKFSTTSKLGVELTKTNSVSYEGISTSHEISAQAYSNAMFKSNLTVQKGLTANDEPVDSFYVEGDEFLIKWANTKSFDVAFIGDIPLYEYFDIHYTGDPHTNGPGTMHFQVRSMAEAAAEYTIPQVYALKLFNPVTPDLSYQNATKIVHIKVGNKRSVSFEPGKTYPNLTRTYQNRLAYVRENGDRIVYAASAIKDLQIRVADTASATYEVDANGYPKASSHKLVMSNIQYFNTPASSPYATQYPKYFIIPQTIESYNSNYDVYRIDFGVGVNGILDVNAIDGTGANDPYGDFVIAKASWYRDLNGNNEYNSVVRGGQLLDIAAASYNKTNINASYYPLIPYSTRKNRTFQWTSYGAASQANATSGLYATITVDAWAENQTTGSSTYHDIIDQIDFDNFSYGAWAGSNAHVQSLTITSQNNNHATYTAANYFEPKYNATTNKWSLAYRESDKLSIESQGTVNNKIRVEHIPLAATSGQMFGDYMLEYEKLSHYSNPKKFNSRMAVSIGADGSVDSYKSTLRTLASSQLVVNNVTYGYQNPSTLPWVTNPSGRSAYDYDYDQMRYGFYSYANSQVDFNNISNTGWLASNQQNEQAGQWFYASNTNRLYSAAAANYYNKINSSGNYTVGVYNPIGPDDLFFRPYQFNDGFLGKFQTSTDRVKTNYEINVDVLIESDYYKNGRPAKIKLLIKRDDSSLTYTDVDAGAIKLLQNAYNPLILQNYQPERGWLGKEYS